MKILIAADKFKHSASSIEVNAAIKTGFLNFNPKFEITEIPLSDGGEGFLAAISAAAVKVHKITARVSDPLGRPITTEFLLTEDNQTAFIEMASASGLQLLKQNELDCSRTTTYGTGELINAALSHNVKHIVIGVGGSATNDCGIGMASALGFKFLNKDGLELYPSGENLIKIACLDLTSARNLQNVSIEIACDVSNYLTGEMGATRMFAKQKGATPEKIEQLEEGIIHFAAIIKRDLNIDILSLPFGGAAGGMGAGCSAFLNAELIAGIELLNRFVKLEEHIKEADLVITGEGKLDKQTLQGKLINRLAYYCKALNKPIVALCGSLELSPTQVNEMNLKAAFSIVQKPMLQEEAFKRAKELIENTAFHIAGMTNIGVYSTVP